MLKPYRNGMHAGISREDASRRAQEVCRVAAETGQTVLAEEHLRALAPMLNGAPGDGATSDHEVRYLGDVQRLEMKPGDVLVLKVDSYLTLETRSRIREGLVEVLGQTGNKALILEKGMEVGVLASPDKAA